MHDGRLAAIKLFRDKKEAFEEMLQLALVGAHRNIVAVLDCGVLAGGVSGIAFERAACTAPTVADFIRLHRGAADSISRTRRIVDDTATGLAHIHACGLVHCDIKPSNLMLFGDVTAKIPTLVAKVGDLGIVEPTLQRLRQCHPQRLGTSSYRAPELVAGKSDFDARIDAWSLGMVVYELAKGRNRTVDLDTGNLQEQIQHFKSALLPQSASQLRRQLGWRGLSLLEELLMEDPVARITVAETLRHDYLNPTRLQLQRNTAGSTTLRGYRSDGALAVGFAPPEILHQWQEEARSILARDFLSPWLRGETVPKRVSLEDNATQYVVHGTNKPIREDSDIKAMCAMPILEQGVITSHNRYVHAFRHVNAPSLDRLHQRLKQRGKTLPSQVLGHANTKHALAKHPRSTMCVGNQEQLAEKTPTVINAKPESLQKPLHFDGTNSFEQWGSTTFGERDVECWGENPKVQGDGSLAWDGTAPEPDVVLRQHPGCIYFGRPPPTHPCTADATAALQKTKGNFLVAYQP
jgi:serine/threonine protein kinase